MMVSASLRIEWAYWTVAKLTNQSNHGTNKNNLMKIRLGRMRGNSLQIDSINFAF
jgi:hypothetical protein